MLPEVENFKTLDPILFGLTRRIFDDRIFLGRKIHPNQQIPSSATHWKFLLNEDKIRGVWPIGNDFLSNNEIGGSEAADQSEVDNLLVKTHLKSVPKTLWPW